MYELSLCTGVLSIFIALPLIFSQRSRPANLWLGLFIFSIGWLSMQDLYYEHPKSLFGVFDPPVAAIGAFYYLYVRNLTGLRNGRSQAWHFLPLAVWSAALLMARILIAPMTLYGWLIGPGMKTFGALLIGFQLLAVGYAAATLWRLHAYRAGLRDNYSSMKARDLIWLRNASAVIIIMLFVWIPATIFGGKIGNAALVLGRLLTLFVLGWYGMRQHAVLLPQPLMPPGLLPLQNAPPGSEPDAMHAPVQRPDVSPRDLPEIKYARSGMSEGAAQLIGERLQRRVVQQRDFLECDIKLTDLAERIGTSPQLLSQYLNQVLGLSFFDYINGLRITEVQSLIGAPSHASTPLLELAFAAGFNSKSTFNASFKQTTGIAPSAWRKLHLQTSEPSG